MHYTLIVSEKGPALIGLLEAAHKQALEREKQQVAVQQQQRQASPRSFWTLRAKSSAKAIPSMTCLPRA